MHIYFSFCVLSLKKHWNPSAEGRQTETKYILTNYPWEDEPVLGIQTPGDLRNIAYPPCSSIFIVLSFTSSSSPGFNLHHIMGLPRRAPALRSFCFKEVIWKQRPSSESYPESPPVSQSVHQKTLQYSLQIRSHPTQSLTWIPEMVSHQSSWYYPRSHTVFCHHCSPRPKWLFKVSINRVTPLLKCTSSVSWSHHGLVGSNSTSPSAASPSQPNFPPTHTGCLYIPQSISTKNIISLKMLIKITLSHWEQNWNLFKLQNPLSGHNTSLVLL